LKGTEQNHENPLGIAEIQVGIWSETFQIRKMDNNQLTAALHTWSGNKVRELIAVKVLHASLLNITVVAFKVPPPPGGAMYRCQRLVHPSKQFWNWFCGMTFRVAIVLLLISMLSKSLLFNISFIFGKGKKSLGGLDPVNGEGIPAQLFVY
jgi:hypothetical protein